jgi:hypothetical protein
MNTDSVGFDLFHGADRRTDGQTDISKLIVVSCNFADSPNDEIFDHYWSACNGKGSKHVLLVQGHCMTTCTAFTNAIMA